MTTLRRNLSLAEAAEQAMLIGGRGDMVWICDSDLTGEGDELRFTGVIFKPSATNTFFSDYARAQRDALKTRIRHVGKILEN